MTCCWSLCSMHLVVCQGMASAVLAQMHSFTCYRHICREVEDRLNAALASFATELEGQEALLVSVAHAQALVTDEIAAGQLQAQAPKAVDAASAASAQTWVLKQAVLWYELPALPAGTHACALCDPARPAPPSIEYLNMAGLAMA